jgi:dipeptidyl-peptidase-4
MPPALSVARIASERDRNLTMPRQFAWSPDGKRLAYLRTTITPGRIDHGNPTRPIVTSEIWSLDAADAKEKLLVSRAQLASALDSQHPHTVLAEDESAAKRRQLRSFAWAPGGHALLLASATGIFWYDLDSHSFRTVATAKPGESDLSSAQISPDGNRVSFIRNHTLQLIDVATATVHDVTPAGTDEVFEGQPDWVYDHELGLHAAYWWSPDASALAWIETDDRAVDKYAMRNSEGEETPLAYPKPGKAIPAIHLFVKPLAGAKAIPIDLGLDANVYIPSVEWLPDGKHLAIERLSRNQKTLELLLADALTGQTQTILTEKDTYWINLGQAPYFLKDSHRFLWTSERTGYRHLYLYDTTGHQLAQLTKGDWQVTSLEAVDESADAAYFTSTEATPLERQLYLVHLDGSGMTRITQTQGTHAPVFSPDAKLLLDTWSDHSTEPRQALLHADGSQIGSIPEPSGAIPAAQLSAPEFFVLKTHMGIPLSASIIKPPGFDPSKKYPVIVYSAGGPGEQAVRDIWGGDIGLWFSLMAQKGYIVFALDNRGTGARGHLFEEPIHLRFSSIEMADVRDGVLYLRTQPWVDAARIGICGWGYGGFLALHGMLDRPLLYKAGFAGSAVSDWRLYDAVFTERYLEDPTLNQDGWLASSPLENAANLRGSLLIAQATLDERVHQENSLILIDELLDSGHYADILLFADRHDLFEEQTTRQVMFQRLTDFFLKNL